MNGWYLLDPECTVKISFANGGDIPLFINSIPSIIDLDTAEGIDRKRQMQQLVKILVQKLPLDKNNDLVFATEKKVGWINIFKNYNLHCYET